MIFLGCGRGGLPGLAFARRGPRSRGAGGFALGWGGDGACPRQGLCVFRANSPWPDADLPLHFHYAGPCFSGFARTIMGQSTMVNRWGDAKGRPGGNHPRWDGLPRGRASANPSKHPCSGRLRGPRPAAFMIPLGLCQLLPFEHSFIPKKPQCGEGLCGSEGGRNVHGLRARPCIHSFPPPTKGYCGGGNSPSS